MHSYFVQQTGQHERGVDPDHQEGWTAGKGFFLDEGFILYKKIGLVQPKRIENANYRLQTQLWIRTIKIYGSSTILCRLNYKGWSN